VGSRLNVLSIAGLLGALLILGSPGRPATAEGESDGPAPASFNGGYRVLDFAYRSEGQEKVLTVAVWYPTAAPPKRYNYGGPTSGAVAVDARPLAERGPFPLLVFSHGYAGSGLGAAGPRRCRS